MTRDANEKADISGIGALFQSFYTELVLRDLFGKAAPGTVILLAVTLSLISIKEVLAVAASATLGAWLFLISLAWLAGLAVQGVGESLRIIRYYPRRLNLSTWQKDLVAFRKVATSKNERDFERYTVVTEACGNGSVAVLLSILVVVIPQWCNFAKEGTDVAVLVLLASAAFGLVNMHFENVERRYVYIQTVLGNGVQSSAQP